MSWIATIWMAGDKTQQKVEASTMPDAMAILEYSGVNTCQIIGLVCVDRRLG